MSAEIPKMVAMLEKQGANREGLLWVISAGLKHELTKSSGYVCNVETVRPDTYLGVPVIAVIKQGYCQLVRVLV